MSPIKCKKLAAITTASFFIDSLQQERVARLPSHPMTFVFAAIASPMSPSPSTGRENGASRRSIAKNRHANDNRKAGSRRKSLQRRQRAPMSRMARLFSRRTHLGSSTANAKNRRTCDRGRIPQPNRTRLWPSADRRSFPQHRQRGAAEYRPGAHDRTHG